jgi:hypothetical protein
VFHRRGLCGTRSNHGNAPFRPDESISSDRRTLNASSNWVRKSHPFSFTDRQIKTSKLAHAITDMLSGDAWFESRPRHRLSWGFTWFLSSHPANTLKKIMTASFHILSRWLLINHRNIQRYIAPQTDSSDIQIIHKMTGHEFSVVTPGGGSMRYVILYGVTSVAIIIIIIIIIIISSSSSSSSSMRWPGHIARMGRRGMHIGYWWGSQKERDH